MKRIMFAPKYGSERYSKRDCEKSTATLFVGRVAVRMCRYILSVSGCFACVVYRGERYVTQVRVLRLLPYMLGPDLRGPCRRLVQRMAGLRRLP